MADKPSDPAADLIELKAYVDQFSKTAWHKSTEDAVQELTLLQQKADAAVAQVGTDMPEDVRLWASGIARDAAKAVDAAKLLDPSLAGNPRDEPALVELTKRLDQIASNAEYAAGGIRSIPPTAPTSAPPSAPPDVVDDVDLTRHPVLPDVPAGAAPDAPGGIEHLEEIIRAVEPRGGPLEDAFAIPRDPEIVPNPVPLHERDASMPIEPGAVPSPMPPAAPGGTHQVIEGSEQSMLPDLVPQPDLSALPVETAYEEPGIWNPDPLAEPGAVPEPLHDDDLA